MFVDFLVICWGFWLIFGGISNDLFGFLNIARSLSLSLSLSFDLVSPLHTHVVACLCTDMVENLELLYQHGWKLRTVASAMRLDTVCAVFACFCNWMMFSSFCGVPRRVVHRTLCQPVTSRQTRDFAPSGCAYADPGLYAATRDLTPPPSIGILLESPL